MRRDNKYLKPLELSDFFEVSFYLLRRNFLLFVSITAILMIPVYTVIGLFGKGVSQTIMSYVAQIIMSLLQPIIVAAATYAISKRYLGETCTVWQAYGAVFKRLWPFIGTILVVSLIKMAGTLAFIFPVVIMGFWYAFVTPVVMMEGLKFKDARIRSKELAQGQWGRIFLINLLFSLIVGFITSILIMPAGVILGFLAATGKNEMVMTIPLWYWIYVSVISSVTMTLQMLIPVLLYYDIRVRKEGFDLELLASSMVTENLARGSDAGAF